MFDFSLYLNGLCAMVGLGLVTWLVSLAKKNVSIVDSVWAWFFVLGMVVYSQGLGEMNFRTDRVAGIATVLLLVWACRLSWYITSRNWGKPEDRRYAAIRANNEPHFAFRSIYIIFGLQALLAWIISLPLLAVAQNSQPLNALGLAGVSLTLFGLMFETIADGQLQDFKAKPKNKGKVMDRGLWRYSRHPNYFGECCVWWGFYLLALSVGGWWAIVSPLLMTFMLLKFSGVALLDKSMVKHNPKYADYMQRTNAFIPRLPKGK